MTKTTMFIGLFLFTFLYQSNCQTEIGIKGGFTNSWPGYEDLELLHNAKTDVSGYNISLFVGMSINDKLGFSFQPAFIKRGAASLLWAIGSGIGLQPVHDGNSKVFLNYFELPIFIHKKFKFKSTSIVPSFGYGLSFLNSASVNQEITSVTRTIVSNIEIGKDSEESLNRLDHGFYFSIRIDQQILQNHFIFFESAYYLGMMDYDKITSLKNRNVNFNFGFGYII